MAPLVGHVSPFPNIHPMPHREPPVPCVGDLQDLHDFALEQGEESSNVGVHKAFFSMDSLLEVAFNFLYDFKSSRSCGIWRVSRICRLGCLRRDRRYSSGIDSIWSELYDAGRYVPFFHKKTSLEGLFNGVRDIVSNVNFYDFTTGRSINVRLLCEGARCLSLVWRENNGCVFIEECKHFFCKPTHHIESHEEDGLGPLVYYMRGHGTPFEFQDALDRMGKCFNQGYSICVGSRVLINANKRPVGQCVRYSFCDGRVPLFEHDFHFKDKLEYKVYETDIGDFVRDVCKDLKLSPLICVATKSSAWRGSEVSLDKYALLKSFALGTERSLSSLAVVGEQDKVSQRWPRSRCSGGAPSLHVLLHVAEW